MEQFLVPRIRLQSDIYSMTFAAFLEPSMLAEEEDLLQRIAMTEEEILNIFIGSVIIMLCQLSVIMLVVIYIMTNNDFKVVPSR